MAVIVALDISGNFNEGKGTTGMAVKDTERNVTMLNQISSVNYETDVDYWKAVIDETFDTVPDYLVIEHYVLYSHKALQQSYSELETSQLLGALRYAALLHDVPVTLQKASEAKGRFPDRVLQAKGHVDEKNRFAGRMTNPHKRDALRHLLYFEKYNMPKGVN